MINRLNRHIGILTVFAVALSFALTSCNGSKAFTKRAVKLEEAGMVTDAANSYYVAVMKNRTNVDAQIGLKRTGQTVLNKKLNEFAQAKSFGNKKEAVYKFLNADEYFTKISNVGVTLEVPEFYLTDYIDVRDSYLADLYDEGTQLLEEEQFGQAEQRFAEIQKLDPEFKDAAELKDIAYLEPLYNDGVSALNAEMYRSAYNNFDKVIKRQSTYKDAKMLQDRSVEEGRYTMAMLHFENGTNQSGLDAKVEAYALDALTSINDPFLKIVDRKHMDLIIEEQHLGLSGIIDEATAVTVGNLLGAKAIVTGTVLNYNTENGKVSSRTIPAYEQYKEKKWNAAEEKYYYDTKYRKTNFKEYYNHNSANLTFQFKVISLATGEVVMSQIIEKEASDEIRYGKYDGDYSKLYPSRNDAVSMNRSERRSLQGLFTARQRLRSGNELGNDLFDLVAKDMKNDIQSFLNSEIK